MLLRVYIYIHIYIHTERETCMHTYTYLPQNCRDVLGDFYKENLAYACAVHIYIYT